MFLGPGQNIIVPTKQETLWCRKQTTQLLRSLEKYPPPHSSYKHFGPLNFCHSGPLNFCHSNPSEVATLAHQKLASSSSYSSLSSPYMQKQKRKKKTNWQTSFQLICSDNNMVISSKICASPKDSASPNNFPREAHALLFRIPAITLLKPLGYRVLNWIPYLLQHKRSQNDLK